MQKKFKQIGILLALGFFAVAVSAQDQWRVFANLEQGRHHHVARYLNGDKILVIGGYVGSYGILDGNPTNTTEIVDLQTGQVTPGPSMATYRTEFPALDLPDGDILVFGGNSNLGPSKVVERYDVATNTWSVIGQMEDGRRQHSADFLNEDEVLIIGGFGSSSAEIFTISTGQSRKIANLPSMANSAVSINPEGRGPSFWGFRAYGPNSDRQRQSIRYSSQTDSWPLDLEFDDAPVAPKLTVLTDGSVLVCSGATGENPFTTSRKTWIVNYLGEVAKGPTLIEGRQWHTLGAWGDSRALVTSGLLDNVRYGSSCEWLDLTTNTSSVAPSLNYARAFSQMIVVRVASGRTRAFVISGLSPVNDYSTRNTPTIEVLEDSCAGSSTIALSTMRRIGSTIYKAPRLEMTQSIPYQAGAAWVRDRVPVASGFDVRFSFRLSNGSDNGQIDNGPQGADGVVMVLQNETRAAVGLPGDGIGYNEIPHGLAIEFDAYRNAAFSDPTPSHIAVQVGDGNILRPWHVAPYLKGITSEGFPPFVADGTVYHARVKLEGKLLHVYCGTTPVLETPVLTVDSIDMNQILRLREDGAAYLGFTSSTGFSAQTHELLSVQIEGCDGLISDVDEDQELPMITSASIIPTPSADIAKLVLPSPLQSAVSCTIVDLQGNVSSRFTIPAGSSMVNLQLESLSAGMYQVVIMDARGAFTVPLVISR
ncbi:MAG: hypothetical protein KA339_06650 [Candidatus Kapabacteria bacterium]|nr:hypothetical protein [Ignavibacteria bacterium]MBP6510220.1 hypothetical protein [Candidatus Kapabacteria bacterium]MBK6419169.1 hypothetical protein [Ignavibacteria bacterium]MBK6760141.1 hypothetical protein [Ignavibacteria bacterium]MBK7412072.1 hypothetical protein [Ignavibacteria bacterium]